MFVLFETAAGYALFKVKKEKKLQNIDEMWEHFQTPEKAQKVLQLVHFQKFKEMQEALHATTAMVEGKLNKTLGKMIKKQLAGVEDSLAVADSKLGGLIQKKYNVNCIFDKTVQELMRCIRAHTDSLLGSDSQREVAAMALGLSHSLSRYKLKFSPDKVDAMVTSGIKTLEDLDKELNNFMMRLKEWYGWHFPELSKIVTDNITYTKVVKAVGHRSGVSEVDLEDLVEDDVERQIKETAEISMGTEISEDDFNSIERLCEQILEMSKTRDRLADYIKTRMMALAPNMSVCVGEMIGAKLIAHAGSLTNLAKSAGSTVQILGAEKALFRALKKKQQTPKYGLLYHAQLVGSAPVAHKGKISRMLAAKTALLARIDAFADTTTSELGAHHLTKIRNRLNQLQGGESKKISGTGKAKAKHDKYTNQSMVVKQPGVASTLSKPDAAGDAGKGKKRRAEEEEEEDEEEEEEEVAPKKKKHKKSHVEEASEDVNGNVEKKKKKKKKKAEEVDSD